MSKRELVRIDVILENCEWYGFDAKGVSVYLSGYRKNCIDNSIYEGFDHIALVISNDAKLVEKESWDDMDNWQLRIDKDITQIELYYNDGSKERYFVDWCEDSDYENVYETDIVEYNRYIYIISKSKKRLEDF